MKRGRKPLDPEERAARAKACRRRYWAEHKEEIAKKRREKYNSKESVASTRKWQKENKEKWNAYLREWRRKKREKVDDKQKA